MKYKVTKTFHNLPCAHAQWFDIDAEGNPGPCASLHGYSRSVKLVLTGEVDDNGWVFGFGDFKAVKKFLEYYFDHTSLVSANDPRIEDIIKAKESGILGTLRIMPYGAGMEHCSRFVFEQVNPYIYEKSDGRVFLEEVEIRENDKNSGSVHPSIRESITQAEGNKNNHLKIKEDWR